MDKEQSKLIPNSTQIPNILLDFIIPRISEAEGKCLLYVCRRTYGFHKERDRISLSQFINGIKDKNGEILDYGTGISRPCVVEALKNLTGAELLKTIPTSKGNYYEIDLNALVDKSPDEVVRRTNQLRELTRSSKENLPKQVSLPNLQKKGNKVTKERVCFQLKDWNERQTSPIADFKPENIINKHGPEKIEAMIKEFGQQNNGFSRFLEDIKK